MSADAAASPESRPSRSPSGRLRSRHNARAHGLTAALPDGEAEAALMQGFTERWTAELRPEVEAEEALIRAAAASFARFERCNRAEADALRNASREAVDRWIARQQHLVRRKAQNLTLDPVNVLSDLEASSFGCEWLQRHWSRLDASMAQGIGWDHRDQALAMGLLGFLPRSPGPDGDPNCRRFYHLMLVACGLSTSPPEELGLPDDPATARSELRSLIAEEFDRLETLRGNLWRDQDGPEAEAIARAGLVDTSKQGQLRERYRREAYSAMVRGLNQVMRIRVERSKDDDRQWRRAHSGRQAAPPTPPPTPPDPIHRNEPVEPASNPADDRDKSFPNHHFRNPSPGGSSDPRRRTEAFPEAPRGPSERPRNPGFAPSPTPTGPTGLIEPPLTADRPG